MTIEENPHAALVTRLRATAERYAEESPFLSSTFREAADAIEGLEALNNHFARCLDKVADALHEATDPRKGNP